MKYKGGQKCTKERCKYIYILIKSTYFIERAMPRSKWRTSSVQFSSVQSLSRVWLLRSHRLQHTRPPCPSPTPRVYPRSKVHWVSDAIQLSHPLFPSPALNLSQYQGLFEWVISSHQVAKVLEFQLQHQSFQWTPRTDLL